MTVINFNTFHHERRKDIRSASAGLLAFRCCNRNRFSYKPHNSCSIAVMPYKEKEIKVVRYDIGELAKMCGVATSMIRYYESQIRIKNRRRGSGDRYYTPKDVEVWKILLNAGKSKKFTLKGLAEIYHTGTITI